MGAVAGILKPVTISLGFMGGLFCASKNLNSGDTIAGLFSHIDDIIEKELHWMGDEVQPEADRHAMEVLLEIGPERRLQAAMDDGR